MADYIWTDPEEEEVIQRAKLIKDLGAGDETSEVKLLIMKDFPGIGGVIRKFQSIPSVYRVESGASGDIGHRRYLIHAILKKLDDYYARTGKYSFAHVARPLGSTADACIYEFVHGSEGFPWEVQIEGGARVPVKLDDWNIFTSLYWQAGIDVTRDITDPDWGSVSKNIIHPFSDPNYSSGYPTLNEFWGRIDFGKSSLHIDYDKLLGYLHDNEASLKDVLDRGDRRFEMLWRAACYLQDSCNSEERDIGRLVELTFNFRNSTLRHLTGVEADYSRK